MCAWWESFKPGNMLLAGSAEEKRGVGHKSVQNFASDSAGIICVDPEPWKNNGVPLLKVNSISDAVFALGAAARQLFRGQVVAVTGTSGKTTTVSLIAHLLAQYGTVSQTQFSANTFYGTAWNMAAMDIAAKWWIVEVAVPKIKESAPFANPDVAVALNVSAGHLQHWKTVKNLAHYKSKIFSGLRLGGYAVINRDLELFELFANEAQKKTENIITFGEAANATLRLLTCANSSMEFAYHDASYAATLPMPGRHTAMNALAALGVLLALGIPLEKGTQRLSSFIPIAGRGARHTTIFDNKKITVIDESYNANPASMRETLHALAEEQHNKTSRVLILGDMLELGEGSAEYHRELAGIVRKVDPHRILLCGNEMRNLWDMLSDEYSGHWYADADDLMKDITAWIVENDIVFIKSSHGTGLHTLADHFLRRA
jgi:UDP-N-acetylmuramoyl-tripeptide--D-alanyl-D-alanine ligase